MFVFILIRTTYWIWNFLIENVQDLQSIFSHELRLGLFLHELLLQCVVEVIAQLRLYWSPVCFDNSLELISIVWLHVSYFPLDSRFLMGFGSGELAGQSSTIKSRSANQLKVVLALWAGAKSCCKRNCHVQKACQRKKAWSAVKISW